MNFLNFSRLRKSRCPRCSQDPWSSWHAVGSQGSSMNKQGEVVGLWGKATAGAFGGPAALTHPSLRARKHLRTAAWAEVPQGCGRGGSAARGMQGSHSTPLPFALSCPLPMTSAISCQDFSLPKCIAGFFKRWAQALYSRRCLISLKSRWSWEKGAQGLGQQTDLGHVLSESLSGCAQRSRKITALPVDGSSRDYSSLV